MDGPRHRCICVRCRTQFSGTRTFGPHLAVCTLPFDVEFVLELVGAVPGDPAMCWDMNDPRGGRTIPKFGVAPGRVMLACNVIAEGTYGPCPPGLMLLHSCDRRRFCANPGHLSWGTARQNVTQAWQNGCRGMSPDQLAAMIAGRRRQAAVKRGDAL